jgi:hypothetical protein
MKGVACKAPWDVLEAPISGVVSRLEVEDPLNQGNVYHNGIRLRPIHVSCMLADLLSTSHVSADAI